MIDFVNVRFLLKIKLSQIPCSAFENPLFSSWRTSFANGPINHPNLQNRCGVGEGEEGEGGLSAFSYNLTITFL